MSFWTTRLQKGYRCHSPDINRYITSIDVTFHENTSFFAYSPSVHPIISKVLPIPYISPLKDTLAHPLQVYHRRPHSNPHASPIDAPTDSPSAPTSVPTADLPPVDSPPIAIRKDVHSIRNSRLIYSILSYHRLSSPYYAYVSSLFFVFVPKTTSEALAHLGWWHAMVDEMVALHSSGTWELVSLPYGKSIVGCCWVYTVKIDPDRKVDRLKT